MKILSGIFLSAGLCSIAKTAPLKQTIAELPKDLQAKTISMNKDFHVFTPANAEKAKKLPMILFLHGRGERGDDIRKFPVNGPVAFAKKNDFPFLVVAPQCLVGKNNKGWWNVNDIDLLLEHVKKTYPVDPKRIYLTGLSMGGFGSWSYAAKHPQKVAAVAPICGGGNPGLAKNYGKLPIWAFHGDKDKIVKLSASQRMVDAIKEVNGNAKLTIYPGVKHNSWSKTYANPKLYQWFLSHSSQ